MKKNLLFIILIVTISVSSQTVSTFAGSCSEMIRGTANGQGTAARFYKPTAITKDNLGNFYVGDSNNGLIRKITANGSVTTIASVSAYLGTPVQILGIVADSNNNIYFSDTYNNKIMVINTIANTLVDFAGTGTVGANDGDGATATFNEPAGLAIDVAGNIVVADSRNHRIRKISPLGVVSTYAGSSAGYINGAVSIAQFNKPQDVAIDYLGNLYVADQNNYRIRKISLTGLVSNYAGNGSYLTSDGIGASVGNVSNLAVDVENNIYFTGNRNIIKRVTPSGEIITAGGFNYTWGSCINGVTNTQFLFPVGLTTTTNGDLYVADSGNNAIRKITDLQLALTTNYLNNDLSLLPNPASNNFTIKSTNLSASKYSIFDIHGRLLSAGNIKEDTTMVDVSDFSTGIYLVQIHTDKNMIVKKLIVE